MGNAISDGAHSPSPGMEVGGGGGRLVGGGGGGEAGVGRQGERPVGRWLLRWGGEEVGGWHGAGWKLRMESCGWI